MEAPNLHSDKRGSSKASQLSEDGSLSTTSAAPDELDPYTAWLYQPHTFSALIIGACFLVLRHLHAFAMYFRYASKALQPWDTPADPVLTTKTGVWAMIAVFLVYCIMQAPGTVLIRPHPALWKFVHGIAVIYLMALTFLLFQGRDTARQLLKHVHPDLGLELPERSYGNDCRIYTPELPNKFQNVYETLFDEFVIAHTLGWWGKAIMIRNNALLWALSIGFELMEVTFHHMLPNFNECWWDSWILDVLLCNFLGIWAGMKTVRYYNGRTYKWIGISQQPSLIGKLKRSISQFTPASWDKDQWDPLSGPMRFAEVVFLCVMVLTVEVNAFFLKFCLWVPPRNPLNTVRLLIWWLIANPAIREYNQFIQNRESVKKLGAFCWLSLAICIVEVLICVKFGKGLFPEPMPAAVFWSWVVVWTGLSVFLVGWAIRDYYRYRKPLKTKRL